MRGNLSEGSYSVVKLKISSSGRFTPRFFPAQSLKEMRLKAGSGATVPTCRVRLSSPVTLKAKSSELHPDTSRREGSKASISNGFVNSKSIYTPSRGTLTGTELTEVLFPQKEKEDSMAVGSSTGCSLQELPASKRARAAMNPYDLFI